MNMVIFVGLMIALFLIIMLLVRSTLGGVETKRPLYQVFLKIFMNHFQILAAIASIKIQWPEIVETVLSS